MASIPRTSCRNWPDEEEHAVHAGVHQPPGDVGRRTRPAGEEPQRHDRLLGPGLDPDEHARAGMPPRSSAPTVTGLDHPSEPGLDQPQHDARHAEGRGEGPGDVEVTLTALRLPQDDASDGRRPARSERSRTSPSATTPAGSSAPPATRPIAPPAADTVVKRPMARTRLGPLPVKTVVSRASEEGAASAAPTPWRARAARSIQPETAKPPKSELNDEDGDARQERPAPAEEVSGPGPQEQEAAEGEQVGVEDPRELAAGEAEARLDVGEGDVDDGRVQDHHELGGQDDEQEHRRGC